MQSKGYVVLLVLLGVVLLVATLGGRVVDVVDSRVVARSDSLRELQRVRALYGAYARDRRGDSASFATFRPQRFKHIELNGADSATLLSVYGIGRVFTARIIAYRAALGGFYAVEQLREVKGVTGEVFDRIYRNFFVDTARIVKICINFASRKQLESHPYITPSMARRIDKERLKGGFFNSQQQLVSRHTLLPGEMRNVARYLSFVIKN